MTAACLTFDVFGFVKKLETVGVEPKVAEVYADALTDLQTKLLEKQTEANDKVLNKFEEYRPTLDEIKIKRSEFATKSDIMELKHEIGNVRNELKTDIVELKHEMDTIHCGLKSDINGMRNELIVKLGSMIAGAVVILIGAIALLH